MYCSIYKTAQTQVEGTEAWGLAQQFPSAVCHDTTNTVFVVAPDNPVDAYYLPLIDGGGDEVPLDQQAVLAAQWLFSDQEHGMVLTHSQATALFNHPAHHLWCATYELPEQAEQFESDYHYVGAFITAMGDRVAWPAFTPELTPDEARQYMLLGLSQLTTAD